MKVLETERLILRGWKKGDVDDLYEYATNPKIGPRAGWKPHKDKAESLKIIQMFIKASDDWAIEHKESKKVIGGIGCRKDVIRTGINAKNLGYVLSEDYWGLGLMTEAVSRMLEYCFDELDIKIVSISHATKNNNSRRVIEKCGFVYEGTLRKSVIFEQEVCDSLYYSIIKDEWCKYNHNT